ncbi:hypothetical protein E3N88_00272 [Mikania micrantha]|uniref:Uncharacterized protein n=1 Tax=Mikania micrantha TaxID=192012 RepID=A0A5N6PZC6_9ASTR|nr:hypothetical protein E3N88_00272 [Mikania micrantha]
MGTPPPRKWGGVNWGHHTVSCRMGNHIQPFDNDNHDSHLPLYQPPLHSDRASIKTPASLLQCLRVRLSPPISPAARLQLLSFSGDSRLRSFAQLTRNSSPPLSSFQ